MTEAIEIKPEQTPGDLKREKIAQKLGQEWRFARNYPVLYRSDPDRSIFGVDGIIAYLELQKKRGEIENWRAEEPAFNDAGEEIPFSQIRAAYIKPENPKPNQF